MLLSLIIFLMKNLRSSKKYVPNIIQPTSGRAGTKPRFSGSRPALSQEVSSHTTAYWSHIQVEFQCLEKLDFELISELPIFWCFYKVGLGFLCESGGLDSRVKKKNLVLVLWMSRRPCLVMSGSFVIGYWSPRACENINVSLSSNLNGKKKSSE